jgi:hypothetical protein
LFEVVVVVVVVVVAAWKAWDATPLVLELSCMLANNGLGTNDDRPHSSFVDCNCPPRGDFFELLGEAVFGLAARLFLPFCCGCCIVLMYVEGPCAVDDVVANKTVLLFLRLWWLLMVGGG